MIQLVIRSTCYTTRFCLNAPCNYVLVYVKRGWIVFWITWTSYFLMLPQAIQIRCCKFPLGIHFCCTKLFIFGVGNMPEVRDKIAASENRDNIVSFECPASAVLYTSSSHKTITPISWNSCGFLRFPKHLSSWKWCEGIKDGNKNKEKRCWRLGARLFAAGYAAEWIFFHLTARISQTMGCQPSIKTLGSSPKQQ